MDRLYLISLFLLSLQALILAKEDLCVCCIFKDDSQYLPEWIEFHQKQGASHFYLYNNLSTDNYSYYLKPYIEQGLVDLIDWPFTYENEPQWIASQCNAYMHSVALSKDKFTWCAFLDSDEFLFSPIGKLTDILPEYKNFAGVCVNWVMYGTSHVEAIPEGEHIRKYLVYRSELSYGHNINVKTIARLDLIKNCINPHAIYYKSNYAVDENFNPVFGCVTTKVSVNKLRINHYWSKDRNYFYNCKLPRRALWNYESTHHAIEMESHMNSVYDPIIAN